MILYDRRLKAPSFLQELQNRSSYEAQSARTTSTANNNNNNNKSDNTHVRPSSVSSSRNPKTRETTIFSANEGKFTHRLCCHHVIDDFNIAPNYKLRIEELDKEIARRRLLDEWSDAENADVNNRNLASNNNNKTVFARKIEKAAGIISGVEVAQSLTLREIQQQRRKQQMIIVPISNESSQMTFENGKSTKATASPVRELDHGNTETKDTSFSLLAAYAKSDHQKSASRKLSKIALVAAKTMEQQQLDRHLDELEVRERSRQDRAKQDLIMSRKSDITLSKHLGFSLELASLQVQAAERNYGLTVQNHLGNSRNAAEKENEDQHPDNTKPLRFGKQFLRNPRVDFSQLSRNKKSSSRSPSTSPTRRGNDNTAGSGDESVAENDQVRAGKTRPTSAKSAAGVLRPTSSTSVVSVGSSTNGILQDPSFFLTNPQSRAEKRKKTEKYYRALGIYEIGKSSTRSQNEFDENRYDGDFDDDNQHQHFHREFETEKESDRQLSNELVERRLKQCMTSQKVNLTDPSTLTDHNVLPHHQYYYYRSSTYKMDGNNNKNDEQNADEEFKNDCHEREDDDDVGDDDDHSEMLLEKLFKSGAMSKPRGTTIPSAPSSSRPTSARLHVKNFIILPVDSNNRRPHSANISQVTPRPPSASSDLHQRKNMWLPNGALSNLMIKRKSWGNKNNQDVKQGTTVPSSISNDRIRQPEQRVAGLKQQANIRCDEETLEAAISTPRGRNNNSSYDPVNSARRTKSDRSQDVGLLMGKKLTFPSNRGVFIN